MELMKPNKKSLPLEPAGAEELLPGINDEVTLAHITTKLTWRDVCVMLSVSRGWLQAIQNRKVYNARVLQNSTETFVIVLHDACLKFRVDFQISFYSMKDKSYHTLPMERRMARKFEILDGKVYTFKYNFKQLCVLDLAAGQFKWKPCGGLRQLTECYDFGVMDEKIYAFVSSGSKFGPGIFGVEVFDPKENTWSLTKLSQRPARRNLQVARVADEFVVYGESYRESDNSVQEPVDFLSFYHPRKDEWRVMKSFTRPRDKLFVVGGRFYTMTPHNIHVYDVQGNSWAHLHSYFIPPFNPSGELAMLQLLNNELRSLKVTPITVADNELLVHWHWYHRGYWRTFLAQTIGFGSQMKELVWQKADFSLFLEQQQLLLITPQVERIQL